MQSLCSPPCTICIYLSPIFCLLEQRYITQTATFYNALVSNAIDKEMTYTEVNLIFRLHIVIYMSVHITLLWQNELIVTLWLAQLACWPCILYILPTLISTEPRPLWARRSYFALVCRTGWIVSATCTSYHSSSGQNTAQIMFKLWPGTLTLLGKVPVEAAKLASLCSELSAKVHARPDPR